jgi:hypothetical protein
LGISFGFLENSADLTVVIEESPLGEATLGVHTRRSRATVNRLG